MELLTAAQMRAVEKAAIDSGDVTGLELMERAGRGVVEAIFEHRPDLARAPGVAVVLCGPGNNGGDGFVVARLLQEKGWTVDVRLYGDPEKLPPDAAENLRRWLELGAVSPFAEVDNRTRLGELGDGDLLIDACFGTGLSRCLPPLVGVYLDHARWAKRSPFRVAIDMPSGVCSDSGKVLTPEGEVAVARHARGATRRNLAFSANLTVTFHSEKVGHRGPHWRGCCFEVVVKDIGLEPFSRPRGRNFPEVASELRKRVVLYDPWDQLADVGKAMSAYETNASKYTHGHVLVLAGGVGKGGAARLAARGALRIGAGLVTVAPPPAALIENAARLDAIMLHAIQDHEALAELLADKRLNAVVAGPGLGVGQKARDMVAVTLAEKNRGVVLDADALTSFVGAPEELFALTRDKSAILTPHLGEFGRLFPDLKEKLDAPPVRGPAYSKVEAAREAAARAGCVLLVKGPDTVVADPRGRAYAVSAQYERACPWLATAGAGDVLAGMIAGLLARCFDPRYAAMTAAWLHQEAARRFGPGLIAEDLPEQLPAVLRDLNVR